MPFPLLPFIGQKVWLRTKEGEVSGILVGLSETGCTVRKDDGNSETYPFSSLIRANLNFPSPYDAFKHLADSGDARHCEFCYLALLYAVDFLAKTFKSQPFASRGDLIKRGLVSFLGGDFPTAAYSLLPQADGIATQILHEDGLLRQTSAFPTWTKEHPNSSKHGKPCKNMVESLQGALEAGDASRIAHVLKWLSPDAIESLRKLRNRLMHGSLIDVGEHEASIVILVLQAMHHGLVEKINIGSVS